MGIELEVQRIFNSPAKISGMGWMKEYSIRGVEP
jgi:hypothetical protein